MNRVSIVLPTYNRLERLQQVLHGLERQQYPLSDFEVVVVSDGSTDGTHEFLGSVDTPLRLATVLQENQGPAAARNAGIERAQGEIILFLDDDVVPAPQFVGEHVDMHAARQNVVVLGPMLSPPKFRLSPWVYWEQEMLMKQYRAMQRGDWEPSARQFYTGNTSVARRHLLESGGFDARFRRAEDLELAYRLARRGLRFVFNPNAVGYHYAERSFRSWLEIPYAYGRNDMVFAREGEQWIMMALESEFQQRNLLISSLVRLCLDRSKLSELVLQILKRTAAVNSRLGLRTLSRFALSAIFNLRYYQGVADELGGRNRFFAAAQRSL